MNRHSLWLVMGAAVMIAAVLGWMRFTAPPPGNLSGSSLGGAFVLDGQDGRSVSDRDFSGKYRLMYFGYTYCPDICPNDLAVLSRGLMAFETADPGRGQRVQPIFITVDPARDTPTVMKAYAAAFHPRLVALTGSTDAIAAVTRAYGIYARKVPTGGDAYLVDHFAVFYLFGPDGAPIAFLPHGSSAAEVTAMLDAHVR